MIMDATTVVYDISDKSSLQIHLSYAFLIISGIGGVLKLMMFLHELVAPGIRASRGAAGPEFTRSDSKISCAIV